MPLTSQQQKKIMDWFTRKKAGMTCPACRANDWAVNNIVTTGVWREGRPTADGEVTPMVQMICKNCYYIAFFAAKPMGVV